MKIENNIFGKNQGALHNDARSRKTSKKYCHSSNYALLTKVQYVLALLRTIIFKKYFINML